MPHTLSKKNIAAALLLLFFLGTTGLHRLYLGRYITGLTMIGIAGLSLFFPLVILVNIAIYFIDLWNITGHHFHDNQDNLVLPHVHPSDCSEKSFRLTFFLAYLLGIFGIHRIYTGKTTTGTIMLVTIPLSVLLAFGGFPYALIAVAAIAIWTFIDQILILSLRFKDDNDVFVAFNHHTDISAYSSQKRRY